MHIPNQQSNVQPSKIQERGLAEVHPLVQSDHDLTSQGLFAIVHASSVFHSWATTDLSTCLRFASICGTRGHEDTARAISNYTHLQLCDIPVLDFSVRRIVRPGHVEPFDCKSPWTSVSALHRQCEATYRDERAPLVRSTCTA